MTCLHCGRNGHEMYMCQYMTNEASMWYAINAHIFGHSNFIRWTVEPLLLCLETVEELKEELFCSICLDEHKKIETVTTNCDHTFCKSCMCANLDHYIATNRLPTCPMCRTNITTLEIKDVDYYDELYDRYVTVPLSTVPENMLDHLHGVGDIQFLDSFDLFPEGIFS